MKQGWIKLHRQLIKSHIWANSTPQQKTILITILLMANHQPGEVEVDGRIIKLDAGQMVTSLDSIAENCGKGVSIQNIRTALKRFEKLEFLTSKSTNKFRVITVCKYASYQAVENETNKQANKGLTTNKNVKELNYSIKGPQPLSILFRNMMLEKAPGLFIDPTTDLPRLKKISDKVIQLVKDKKKKDGHPYFHCSKEEAVAAFKFILDKFPAWELEHRFYPEYILANFGTIINKIRNPKTQGETAEKKLSLKSFKNLQ